MEAISYYLKAIQATGTNAWYFAPNSCLKIGNIYEKQGEKAKAEQYYKKALAYDSHPYKNSIDAEAKAGLNRIE
jgi:tetratricopeptide (TPR) repeat protein